MAHGNEINGKKYFWLKLDRHFFGNARIKKLRRLAGGDTYTIIYLKLLLLSIEFNGLLVYEGIEDTFEKEMALINLVASDVGAYGKSETDTKVAKVKTDLQDEMEELRAVGYALESEKTSGVVKGSPLDKRLAKIEKALHQIIGG